MFSASPVTGATSSELSGVSAVARVASPCAVESETVLHLPPSWWRDAGTPVEGGRSRDLSFDADAAGTTLWLLNESTVQIREYRAGSLVRVLGPIPDGVIDMLHLDGDRFALLYAEPLQVVVYDAKTQAQAVTPRSGLGADEFLVLTTQGVHHSSFERSQWLLSPKGLLGRAGITDSVPLPNGDAGWHIGLFRGRDFEVTPPAGTTVKAEPARFTLGPGNWTRRGIVFDSSQAATLIVSHAEPATEARVAHYEAVFAVPLNVPGQERSTQILRYMLASGEFSPPIRRPVLRLNDGRLLQLTSDTRGTRVLRTEPLGAATKCAAAVAAFPAEASFVALPDNAVRGAGEAHCSTAISGDWLRFRCLRSSLGNAASSVTLSEPFTTRFQTRVASGTELRIDREGLVERLTRTVADNTDPPGDYAELVVPFTRGTHLDASIGFALGARQLTLEWPAARALPTELGELKPARGHASVAGDH